MLKNKIDLIRDGKHQVLLTWNQRDEAGKRVPVAIEYVEDIDADMRKRIEDVVARPIVTNVGGASTRAPVGSPAHFENLPKVLSRLGFRARLF